MKKYILALSMACMASVFVGCSPSESTPPKVEVTSTAVEVMEVSSSDLSNTVKLSGKIIASREVLVFPPLPSTVDNLFVNIGDEVSTGETLFSLDGDEIADQYGPLKRTYDDTKMIMDKTLIQLQNNYDNTLALYNIGAASKIQVDQAELTLLQQKTSMEGQLSNLETNMDKINDTLVDASVTSPISGIVTQVNVVESMIASNTQPAVVISDTSEPQVRIDVSETIIPYIKSGDTVLVTIPSVALEPFEATIRSVAPATDMQTGMYAIKIDLPTDKEYTMGMFAEVLITTNEVTATLNIPSSTILTDGEVKYIFTVNTDDNTSRKVIVTTGITNGQNTQITSGLIGGEKLVVTGQEYLSDNSLVNITGGQ